MSDKPRRIIIDTDPGKDDAVAILLALASSELDVIGITTVAGNVSLDLTIVNACKICELAGRPDMGIYPGAPQPMFGALETAEHVHGRDGLGGPDLPAPKMKPQDQHAVDFIIETLRRAPEKSITICALAPLTNIALALTQAPDIATRIAEIVLMGGGYFAGGNVTPAAEFNMFVDPHAAQIVLQSGAPITMLPLDCTNQVIMTEARIAAIRALGTRVGAVTGDLIDFIEEANGRRFGGMGTPLHDPNVIACLIDPSLYVGKSCNVEIETSSALTMGMSVVDWWGVSGRPANVCYMRETDHEGFFALLLTRLAQL